MLIKVHINDKHCRKHANFPSTDLGKQHLRYQSYEQWRVGQVRGVIFSCNTLTSYGFFDLKQT